MSVAGRDSLDGMTADSGAVRVAAIAGISLWLTLSAPAVSAGADVDFLVPGVSLGSVDFAAGTSVSYLVISEAHGIADTSVVTLTVRGAGPDGSDLEISSTSWPPVEDEAVTVRLTLCPDAQKMKIPEDFYACVGDILVKRGTEDFREPSLEELEDFDIGRIFLERDDGLQRSQLEPESVMTPAGSFECDVFEYFRSESRDVDMGGIKARRSEEERSILRISRAVPFWGLVRSRVERTTGTEYLGGSRARDSRPAVTVTESVLVDYSTPGRSAGK